VRGISVARLTVKPKHIFQIVLLSAVWGVSFLMMRVAVVTFPPVWISLLRCALGASLLWTVLLIGGYSLPPRRLAPWLLIVATLNNAVPFTFFAWGERTVPSNMAAVLNATVPIWILLFSMLIYRRRTGPRMIASVLLSFVGVVIVIVGQSGGKVAHEISAGTLFGVFIIALAAVSYAIATLVAKTKLQGLDAMGLATTQLSLATALLLPVALAGDHPSALHAGPMGAVAVLGFAGSGVAYLLYYRLLEEISATQLAGVTYLMPIWGLFWGLFADEPIGISACVGVAITVCGLALMNRQVKPAEGQSVIAARG
jgi:drug/metabolite transporter (DMT)-like permease